MNQKFSNSNRKSQVASLQKKKKKKGSRVLILRQLSERIVMLATLFLRAVTKSSIYEVKRISAGLVISSLGSLVDANTDI